jgi:hypothetical protein
VVPIGFFVFMLSMGVAVLRRRSRVKGVTEDRCKHRDVLGLRASIRPRLSGSRSLVVMGGNSLTSHLRPRRNPLAVMAAWRWFRRSVSSANVVNRSYLDPRLG